MEERVSIRSAGIMRVIEVSSPTYSMGVFFPLFVRVHFILRICWFMILHMVFNTAARARVFGRSSSGPFRVRHGQFPG